MPLFPMFVDLKDRTVLLIGEGHHAEDKAAKLAPFGAVIRRVSLADFRESDLSPAPAMVVLTQTGHPDNAGIADLCAQLRIPVNAVDDPRLCTVRFPALVTRGELSVGIATNGLSPVTASLIKESLSESLPEDLESILTWSGTLTSRLRKEIPDYAARTRILRRAMTMAFAQNRPLTESEVNEMTDPEG